MEYRPLRPPSAKSRSEMAGWPVMPAGRSRRLDPVGPKDLEVLR
jgi:hypothetical protein